MNPPTTAPAAISVENKDSAALHHVDAPNEEPMQSDEAAEAIVRRTANREDERNIIIDR